MAAGVALISGGSRGIGRAVAEELAGRGYDVAICALNEDRLSAVARDLSVSTMREVLPIPADFGIAEDIAVAVSKTLAHWGQIDVLVNNAGSSAFKPFLEADDDDWYQAIDLKFMGYVRACREVLPHMINRGSGTIINVIGNAGLQAIPTQMISGALCAALIHFTKGLALECAHAGVRVNAISPGPTQTDRWRAAVRTMASQAGTSEQSLEEEILNQVALGRVAQPSEMARVVAFLASADSSYMTGTNVLVDGGMTRGV